MKYGVYYRSHRTDPYIRTCEYRKNRKGLLTAYPRVFDTYKAAEEFAKSIHDVESTKIKEVKA